MQNEALAIQFETASQVLHRNLDGLTHDDSLVQPASAGNCLNWVVGHLVRTRNQALGALGREAVQPVERYAAYSQEPVLGEGEGVLAFDDLVRSYDETQGPLLDALRAASNEDLAAKAPFSPSNNPRETVGSLIQAIAFHEAYHTGQAGLLRRVVGKAGAIDVPEAVR